MDFKNKVMELLNKLEPDDKKWAIIYSFIINLI